MNYKEIENRKEGSKYHFYKNNKIVATVYKDKISVYEDLTKEEIKYIKKVATM